MLHPCGPEASGPTPACSLNRKDTMSDPVALLLKDHRTVEGMFASYNGANDVTVLQQLLDELVIHDAIEREIIYPALSDAGVDVEGAEEDHDHVKNLIVAIRAEIEINDGDLSTMVNSLEGSVALHVDREEAAMLPALNDLDEETRTELTRQIEAMKAA